MDSGGKRAEVDAGLGEALAIADEIRALMKRLIVIDPNAINRIEEVFRRVRVEKCVEKRLN
jgi:hypothetical protein